MGSKVSACLYIDRQVLETAKQVGLNVSRVSENALIRAIERLEGRKPETGLNSRAEIEGRGLARGQSQSLTQAVTQSFTHTRLQTVTQQKHACRGCQTSSTDVASRFIFSVCHRFHRLFISTRAAMMPNTIAMKSAV